MCEKYLHFEALTNVIFHRMGIPFRNLVGAYYKWSVYKWNSNSKFELFFSNFNSKLVFDFRSDLEVAFLRYDDVKVGAIVSVSIEEKMHSWWTAF